MDPGFRRDDGTVLQGVLGVFQASVGADSTQADHPVPHSPDPTPGGFPTARAVGNGILSA